MTLKEYFDLTYGVGILSTADSEGKVDAAIYSTPHVFENGTVAFVMRERLTYRNLRSNSYAVFLYIEHEAHYKGVRLFLRKIGEDDDPALIASMTRRVLSPEEDQEKGPKHLVRFAVERILDLVGGAESLMKVC